MARIMKFREKILPGEMCRWYMAPAHYEMATDVRVCYPLIVHLIVRFARDLHFWLMCVGLPGYRDGKIQGAYWSGWKKGIKVARSLLR